MNAAIKIFDRRLLRQRRDRVAARGEAHGDDRDFLFVEIADRLADRLADIRRSFPLALDLGCRRGAMGAALLASGKIRRLVQCDLSVGMARLARARNREAATLTADEETLPFAPGSFDLVASALALHWTNDVPGALAQIGRAMNPDGLALIALFGGETLIELRAALLEAEAETAGGASPRVSPMIDVADAGQLLQRAGFALPVVDSDRLTVRYPDAFALMRDLRAMGETNAVLERHDGVSRRATLLAASRIYAERFPAAGGGIRATFQVITLTGWAPHESQQKPLRPGSAAQRLADALETEEHPTDVPTAPKLARPN